MGLEFHENFRALVYVLFSSLDLTPESRPQTGRRCWANPAFDWHGKHLARASESGVGPI